MCNKPYTMLDAYPYFKDYLSDDEMLELNDYDACTRNSLQKLLPGWTVEGDACEMYVSKEFPAETGLMPFKVYNSCSKKTHGSLAHEMNCYKIPRKPLALHINIMYI